MGTAPAAPTAPDGSCHAEYIGVAESARAPYEQETAVLDTTRLLAASSAILWSSMTRYCSLALTKAASFADPYTLSTLIRDAISDRLHGRVCNLAHCRV